MNTGHKEGVEEEYRFQVDERLNRIQQLLFLFQVFPLLAFANGLVHDSVVVAGFFFLLLAQGFKVLGNEAGQALGIGGVKRHASRGTHLCPTISSGNRTPRPAGHHCRPRPFR